MRELRRGRYFVLQYYSIPGIGCDRFWFLLGLFLLYYSLVFVAIVLDVSFISERLHVEYEDKR